MAESAGISMEAMKLEVNKAYKRRMHYEKKKQEKINLAPMEAMQPKNRAIHYDNMKSAVAEEGILAQILREPAMLEYAGNLTGQNFSVPLLGKVFDQLCDRYRSGMEVSTAVLSDLTPEEMAHVAGISQRHQGPVNETAFRDCVEIVTEQNRSAKVSSDEDLRAFQKMLKESKGTNT